MTILKDETTARLDDMTRLADETLTLYDDLLNEIEDDGLRREISANIRKQRELIQALFRARQSRNALPQAGEPERGHILALIASIQSLVTEDDAPVVDKFLRSNSHLREAAISADEITLPSGENELVKRLIELCDSLEATLHTAERTHDRS